MNGNRVDWTDAYTGRMQESDTTGFASALDGIASEFSRDVASGKLPFINMPYWSNLVKDLRGLEGHLKRFDHLLLLGIGGSALGARALQKAFFPQQDRPCHGGPWLWIADNVDAPSLEAWFASLPPEKTLVTVVSKSGGTIETISQYFLARQWLESALGDRWKEHVVLVTDEANGFLRQEAERLGAASLPVPDNLGGRYSVLSAVGLVPAVFLGLDWEAMGEGALAVGRELTQPDLPAEVLARHESWKLALWNRALMDKGYSQIIFLSYIPQWAWFGDWFAQLWAESLGKEGVGSMPLPAVGVTDQHSIMQMFLDGPRDKGCLFLSSADCPPGPLFPDDLPDNWSYLRGRPFGDLLPAETLGSKMALTLRQTPLTEVHLTAETEHNAGRLIALLEIATLLTGRLLGINPLDQPAVELGKRLANARLGAPGYGEETEQLGRYLKQPRQTGEF